MAPETLVFVQFIHPGGEHGEDSPGRKEWNPLSNAHRRKFLIAEGAYVLRDTLCVGTVGFWGEWEPPSVVVAQHPPLGNLPRFVHKPVLETPPNFAGLQNTDPFVFGPQFLYTGCQQHTNKGTAETQLRRLTRGSVILFGSRVDSSRFVVDTVFVVADHIDHSFADHRQTLQGVVPDPYWTVTLGPWYADDSEESGCVPKTSAASYRLYRGATYDERVDGMFSFVPCRPVRENGDIDRFARPEIQQEGKITRRLTQGKKITKLDHLIEARGLWDDVVRQVVSEDLALGVLVDLPDPGTL
ncbi:MAG: hypothetical protein GY722_00215 [bacterium]|nr:hypothetical protein [bacterium]